VRSTALILASASPRRRELLEVLGIPFTVVKPEVDESLRSGEIPAEFAARVARDKGEKVARQHEGAVVLSADTIVSLGGAVFGKPRDRDDAIRMLESLSGHSHSVYTAVSAIQVSTRRRRESVRETKVWFSDLDRSMIDDYLSRENVLDKAGAYAIQGFASVFIPRIEGDYTNVVGLPLELTWDLLADHGLTCRT
jgi:septum formation protein